MYISLLLVPPINSSGQYYYQTISFISIFPFKWGLPYCVSPLCHPVMPNTHCSRQKSPAAPCVTSTCHAKRRAWHMHRSLLSLNARLEQPSERRLAHRLCHQSRWADHSEYIESLSSVKSALDSTLWLVAAKIPHSCLWLMYTIRIYVCYVLNLSRNVIIRTVWQFL